jgi:hypothetical protein
MNNFLKIGCVMALTMVMMGCDKKNDTETSQIPATPPVPGTLVVVAKLVEIPGQFPPNELYNYAYTMKYKVEKVIQGEYTNDIILIAHYNPRFARDAITDDQKGQVGGNVKTFRVGDTHYLVLNPLQDKWSGANEDEYYKESLPRWWASWVDKI